MNKIKGSLSLFTRFITVGVSNTIIDFFVFFLLVHIGSTYLISQIAAYIAGMINSFIWNRLWTFKISDKLKINEVIRFVLINLLALSTTFFLLTYLHEESRWPLLVSKVFATGGGICITFIGSRFWVFREKEQQQLQES